MKIDKRIQVCFCGLMLLGFTLTTTASTFAKSKPIEQMPTPDTLEFIVEDEGEL